MAVIGTASPMVVATGWSSDHTHPRWESNRIAEYLPARRDDGGNWVPSVAMA